VSGNTVSGIVDGLLTSSTNGLTQDLSPLIRKALGLNSNQQIPSNVKVVKISKFDKVSASYGVIISEDYSYDVFGYELLDNSFSKNESLNNSLLTAFQFKLPETSNNTASIPSIGDYFKVSFHIMIEGDTENVLFSKSGTLYTDSKFSTIESISVSSGFTSSTSQNATLSVYTQNQPAQGSRYNINYDYLAPKPNERINIRYNKNQIITDNTFAIETTRPVGADVLVKASKSIIVDIDLAIVVSSGFEKTSDIVKQNVKDAVVKALNATQLGTIVDRSDFINTAYSINGVDRVRITRFNRDGIVGMVESIKTEKNEYIQANEVNVTIEER
jgi:hypothetical protein